MVEYLEETRQARVNSALYNQAIRRIKCLEEALEKIEALGPYEGKYGAPKIAGQALRMETK